MTQNRPSTQEIAFIPGHPEFRITNWLTKEGDILTSVDAVKDYNKRYNNSLNAYDGIIDVDRLLSEYDVIAKPAPVTQPGPIDLNNQLLITNNLLTVQCNQLQKLPTKSANDTIRLGMYQALLEILNTVPINTQVTIINAQSDDNITKINQLLMRGAFISASLDVIKHSPLTAYALETPAPNEAAAVFERLMQELTHN